MILDNRQITVREIADDSDESGYKVVWLIWNTTMKLCIDCAKQFVRNAQELWKIQS